MIEFYIEEHFLPDREQNVLKERKKEKPTMKTLAIMMIFNSFQKLIKLLMCKICFLNDVEAVPV